MTTGEIWPVGKLQGWDKNPRSIEKKDFERLVAQIKKHGVYKPLIVNQDGIIVGGNMRFKALQYLEVSEVWVSIVQTKDEAEMLEIALSDNDRAGSYDEEALAEMVSLYDIDQELYTIDTGKMLSIADVKNKYGPDPEEDEAPDVAEGPAESKLGEIYELGQHRLMCGDATSGEDVDKLMAGQRAHMVFTDPPWNVAIGLDSNPRHRQRKGLDNDNLSPEKFSAFVDGFIKQYVKYCAGDLYCVLGAAEWPTLDQQLRNNGFHWSASIIWVKDTFVLGRSKYHRRYEPIWYGWHKDGISSFNGRRDIDDVWEFPRPKRSDVHPTMKPIKLCAEAINNSSKPGEIVLDLFGGSGSTLIAAEETGRSCYMMELDPAYCDVIRKRYELLVQSKAA